MRKNKSLSSIVDRAGDVADGDTITIPFARATCERIAVVTPEQSAPTMALTLSAVTRRSAAAVAAAESIQVESARTDVTFMPFIKLPAAFTSEMASSAPAAISGVRDSIGPVYPRIMPIFASSASAGMTSIVAAAAAVINFFILLNSYACMLLKHQARYSSHYCL